MRVAVNGLGRSTEVVRSAAVIAGEAVMPLQPRVMPRLRERGPS